MTNNKRTYGDPEVVSVDECAAWRMLYRDEYTIPELAFMFEKKDATISRHVNRECHHMQGESDDSREKWSDDELLTAYRIVRDMIPYPKLTLNTYDNEKPDDFPSGSAIQERFGGWSQAREQAGGYNE